MANTQFSVFMEGPRTLPDPLDHEPVCWVTVRFHSKMAETHWDEDLMKFVIAVLQNGGGEIGYASRHGLSCKCISLPITGVPACDQVGVRKAAERIAEGWHMRILDKTVRLDRERIFFQRGGKPTSPPEVVGDNGSVLSPKTRSY